MRLALDDDDDDERVCYRLQIYLEVTELLLCHTLGRKYRSLSRVLSDFVTKSKLKRSVS